MAKLLISTEVENQGANRRTINLVSRIVDKKGEVVARAETQSMWLDPGTSITLSAETTVEHPLFWSLEEPNLYQLLSTVQDANSAGRNKQQRTHAPRRSASARLNSTLTKDFS